MAGALPYQRFFEDRYRIIKTPDDRAWVIVDLYWSGWCTLPDPGDPTTLMPLEWRSKAAAEAWLHRCYKAWGERPRLGRPHPANIPARGHQGA